MKAGMFTTALVELTSVNDCKPVPALTWSTVTEPGPLATPKEGIPPGKRSPSVTVVVGVQPFPGVGVGLGVDVGVGVGVGVGVEGGVGVGVGIGVGVGVGLPPTVMVTGAETVIAPELSNAFAVSV